MQNPVFKKKYFISSNFMYGLNTKKRQYCRLFNLVELLEIFQNAIAVCQSHSIWSALKTASIGYCFGSLLA